MSCDGVKVTADERIVSGRLALWVKAETPTVRRAADSDNASDETTLD